MSELSEIRVNLVFRGRQLAEFLAIKEHLGVQTNADVVRYLVRRHARALQWEEEAVTHPTLSARREAEAQRGASAATQRRGNAEAQREAEEDVWVRPHELAHLCLDCPLPECDEGDLRCPYQRATGERERQRERTRAYMRRVRAK